MFNRIKSIYKKFLDLFKPEIIRDESGKILSYSTPFFWEKYEYNDKGLVITYSNSDNVLINYEYDDTQIDKIINFDNR